MFPIIGISPAQVKTSTEGREFRLGTVGGYDDPVDGLKLFLYVLAGEAITDAGYVCQVNTGYSVEMVDLTSTAPGAGVGKRCGAAMAAIALNGFGWIQIYGKGSVRTLASAAIGTRLNSTATSGAVDDDGTAGSEPINGLTLGTATGGAPATNADAYFNFPVVGHTI